ncbi:MAG: hypothetical protein NC084_11980 [Bacteroides sp.]|nr:hypothetical protein [Eubacterium sp.]MCM1419301.1 hypothetical protein [Roseburia sp.]MCM1463411.1 hypothetical protein [Bacteroides sp.]
MATKKREKFLNFNDGIARIYRVENAAENGDRNVDRLKLVDEVRYQTHTVGIARFYEAMQFEIRIAKAIVIPAIVNRVTTQDVIFIGGTRYKIEQIQERADTKPPSLLISLSETEV